MLEVRSTSRGSSSGSKNRSQACVGASVAVGTEFGPVLDHGGVEIQLAALRQQMGTDRSSAFRRGCDQRDGVLVPRTVRLAIGKAAPQVDDRAAAYVDAACRTDLAGVSLEVRPEGIGDLPPPSSTCSCNCPCNTLMLIFSVFIQFSP